MIWTEPSQNPARVSRNPCKYALEKIGKPESDLEKLKVFVGPPLLDQFMKYADLDEETARKAVNITGNGMRIRGFLRIRCIPAVANMLNVLKNKGYRLAVASSKPEYFVKKVLDHFHLTDYFEVIVGSEMNGARTGKAEVIEETLRRLGLSGHAGEAVMIGDREHDVLGAAACGMKCLGVTYGYGSEEELTTAGALKTADSADGVLDFSPDPSAQTISFVQGVEGDISLRDTFPDQSDCGVFGRELSAGVGRDL